MSTDTAEPLSLQTGVTSAPFSSNAQDFSGSDDDILDNFAEGPQPGDHPPAGDTHDDGTPMGLGGEKGKQSEPASSTLEADILKAKQPAGEKIPPTDAASEPEPEEPAGETGTETSPEPTGEPEAPEFPPVLLQMAGLDDAKAAKAAGFETPDALFAAIKWRGQLLNPTVETPQSSTGLYRRTPDTAPVAPPKQETATEAPTGFKAFEIPADKRDMFDEELVDVLDKMNQHYQQQLESLQSVVGDREAELAQDEEARFDAVVQGLGEGWKDVFGEGDGRLLARAGERDPVAMTNFNHRALLFEAVEAVREVNAKQGYKPMSLEQEVQWALMQRYPDKFQQVLSGGSSTGSGPRQGVTAHRPTQRKTPPRSHNEKVLADINAMLQKKGRGTLDMGHEEEFDGEI